MCPCRFAFTFVSFALLLSSLAVAQDTGSSLTPPKQDLQFAVVRYDAAESSILATLNRIVYETVEQTYTVQVPYTVTGDGGTKTEMRQETRTRTVTVERPVTEEVLYRLEDVSFSSVSGKRVTDLEPVKRFLQTPRPTVITNQQEVLGSYFQQIFKPTTIVMHVKASNVSAPTPDASALPAPAPIYDPFADTPN